MFYEEVAVELPTLLSTDELCASFGVSRQWVKRRLEEGELRRFKLGRFNRFLLSDVQDYVSRHNDGRALPLGGGSDDFIADA